MIRISTLTLLSQNPQPSLNQRVLEDLNARDYRPEPLQHRVDIQHIAHQRLSHVSKRSQGRSNLKIETTLSHSVCHPSVAWTR